TTADFDNVGGALDNLDGRTTTNTSNIANVQAQANQGFNISADNGTADNVQLGETVNFTNTDGNLVATVSDNGINYDLAENIDLGVNGSVRTGNTVTNNAGITILNGPVDTVTLGRNGLNNGGNRVTNVANGLAADDAATFGQVTDVNDKVNTLGDSTAATLGGGATYTAATGTVSAPTYTLNDGTNTGTTADFDNVGGALNNLDGRTTTNTSNIDNIQAQANQGFNISADNGTADNVQLGETVNFTNTDGNLVATVSDNGINYDLAENIELGVNGSVRTGNTVTNNAGVRIDDGTGNITGVTATGTNVTDGTNTSNYGANGFTIVGGPSITTAGINAGNKVITNLADGVAATDAATKGQVDAVSNGLTDLTAGAVQYQRNLDDTVNYDNVTFAGTQAVIGQDGEGNDFVASGGTRLSNVANGINAADAVNKGQLDGLIAQNITNVEVNDQNGNPVTVNITDQVVNRNIDNSNMDSLFLTYNVEGQGITDRLTIGETVQKMNTEGVKFAHTNAVSAKGDLGITNDSSAGGDNSTAIGVNAIIQEGADSTVALGHNTEASANATNSVVIGKDSQVTGQSSIAIGNGAQALGNQSISIGTGNIVNGDNSGAFGDPSIINGDNSYSVGNNNTINSNDTFVLGNNVTSTVGGSVVLGTGSAARTGAGVVGYLAAGNAAITATTSTTGAVAVGDATNGIYRQVTGVAAGTADSDAVNVSQLKAVSDTLQNNNEALSNAAVQYDKNADGTVNKGSITLGGGAAGTTITNVAAGNVSAGSTDAVNGSQLHNLGSGVASIIGGDAALDASGNLTASNIGGTGKGNINDAIAAVNQGNAQANENIQANTDRLDAGLNFGADSGTTINKPIGDTTALKFEGGNNITTMATSSGIKFDLNGNIDVDNITADTVTTGNTTVNNSGVTIKDGPSMTTAGINAGNKTITGVADGIEVNDAVNLGQLSALDNKLSNSVNELGYKINEVEDDANAGVSAAMAMSSLPQAYIPGKSMVGGGIATYNGQSAVAIGVSKVSDNGRWVIKVNGTADTQGNAGGAVGAGFHF
ncbi:MAG: YadA-like family protein, partial [Psychrobacter alimentarius]